jgi:high frequency lysogenization protein
MTSNIHNRTVALAGLYQCVDLVTQVAWEGRVDPLSYKTSLYSLFNINPLTYDDVFGGVSGIIAGLGGLRDTLIKHQDAHVAERTRYSVMLIFLEKKLSKNRDNLEIIKEGMRAASAQLGHFEPTHSNVVAKLADVYRNSISPLGPKIIIRGEQAVLSNPDNAARIRALLLAGIRAVMLWRQAGGTRWRLLFERKAILNEIDQILATY